MKPYVSPQSRDQRIKNYMEKIGSSSVQANISSQTAKNTQLAAGKFANITGSIDKPQRTPDSKTTPNTPGTMVGSKPGTSAGSKPGSSQKKKKPDYDADGKKDSNKHDNKMQSITDTNKEDKKASSDASMETNQKKLSYAGAEKFDDIDETNKPPPDMDPLPDEAFEDIFKGEYMFINQYFE